MLYDPLRTLRYQALNPLSSSSRWAYFDSPLVLRPWVGVNSPTGSSTSLWSSCGLNCRNRMQGDAGPTGSEPGGVRYRSSSDAPVSNVVSLSMVEDKNTTDGL